MFLSFMHTQAHIPSVAIIWKLPSAPIQCWYRNYWRCRMGPSCSAIWGLSIDCMARISFQTMNLNKAPLVLTTMNKTSVPDFEGPTQNYIPVMKPLTSVKWLHMFNPIPKEMTTRQKQQLRSVSWVEHLRTDCAGQKRRLNPSLSLSIVGYCQVVEKNLSTVSLIFSG